MAITGWGTTEMGRVAGLGDCEIEQALEVVSGRYGKIQGCDAKKLFVLNAENL